jgi:hypothetical protein
MKQLRNIIVGDDNSEAPVAGPMVAVPLPEAPSPIDDDIALDEPIEVPVAPVPIDLPDEPVVVHEPSPLPGEPIELPAAPVELAADPAEDPDVAPVAHESVLLRDGLDAWPDWLEGVKVLKISGRQGDHSYNTRLAVQCPCCLTKRSRSTELQRAELGDKAVLAFLGCWLKARHTNTPAEHKAFRPQIAQLREYRDQYLS